PASGRPAPTYRAVAFIAAPVAENGPFGATAALFGDGSLALAFTPGDTLGHLSLIARLGERGPSQRRRRVHAGDDPTRRATVAIGGCAGLRAQRAGTRRVGPRASRRARDPRPRHGRVGRSAGALQLSARFFSRAHCAAATGPCGRREATPRCARRR